MRQYLYSVLLAALAWLGVAPSAGSVVAAERLRLLVETDAGGDPDDEQSLVRWLLYANEWDVEGIIANRPTARQGENRNPERTGLGIVRRLLAAYGECWTHLVQHDPRYPTEAALLARTVAGDNQTEAAVNLIIAAVDRPDPRPLWYSDWGTDQGAATNNLRRALDRIWSVRGPAGYAAFKSRLRLTSYDNFGQHTSAVVPPFPLWIDTFRPPVDGKRWYHRFSELTSRAGGFDLRRDVLTGHGPLGALYPTNTTHWCKEGDSMTFIYLLPTGLSDPNRPEWGGWAGRYGLNTDQSGKPYYWANQPDAWNGTTHRDNSLARWAAALQNDFRARLDWCVKPRTEANHPPELVVNGAGGHDILQLQVQAGAEFSLDASSTRDPDGQSLRFEWFAYPEAGTYRGEMSTEAATTSKVAFRVPVDAVGKTLHWVLAVTDGGQPPLTRYRRVVVTATAGREGTPAPGQKQ